APPPSDGQTRKSLDPGRSIRILPLDLKRLWLKALRTLGALALVLLPTHVPRWLDAEAPVAEPLTVVRGTITRHSTLASALEGLLSPPGFTAWSRRPGPSTTWPACRSAAPSASPSDRTACCGPSPTGSTRCGRSACSGAGRLSRSKWSPARSRPGWPACRG